MAEAGLTERKTVLGWEVDTRSLTIALPQPKLTAWYDNITLILLRNKTTHSELESLIGRLNHIANVISHMRHFFNRLYLLLSTLKHTSHPRPLTSELQQDLKLHQQFLLAANKGINMNTLTYRCLIHIYVSDACPQGLGGWSCRGRVWRFQIPIHLQRRCTINFLEFLAATVSPWVDILEETLPPLSCALSMTESSTTEGWLRKSNFREEGENEQQQRENQEQQENTQSATSPSKSTTTPNGSRERRIG